MPITVSTGHTLSRTLTGYVRAVKIAGTQNYTVYLCQEQEDPWEWYTDETGAYSSAVHVHQLFLGVQSGVLDACLPLAFTLNMIPSIYAGTPADPVICPDSYEKSAAADYYCKILWELTGAAFGDPFEADGVVLAETGYNSLYGLAYSSDTFGEFEEPPFAYHEYPHEGVTYDISIPFSVSLSGTFKLMADYSTVMSSGLTGKIEQNYPADNDPYGMSARILEYYYIPISDIQVDISIDEQSVYSESFGAMEFGSQALFEAAMKNGFGTVDIAGDVRKTWDKPDIYPANTYEDMGEMFEVLVGGMPNAGSIQPDYNLELEYPIYIGDPMEDPILIGYYTAGVVTWGPTSTGGTYAATSCNGGMTHQARWVSGSGDTVYNLTTTDYDGTVRNGVIVDVDEFDGDEEDWEWPANTKEANVRLTTAGSGTAQYTVRHPGQISGFEGEHNVTNRFYEFHDTGQGSRLHNAANGQFDWPPVLGVTNLDALSEPKFPYYNEKSFFHDGRVELGGPGLRNESALVLTTPATQKRTEFDSATGWTVSPVGGATISVDGGKLKVEVGAAPCAITKDFDTNSWAGARFADLLFTADTTLPVTVEIEDGRLWEVSTLSAASKEFDLATPRAGVAANSTAQSRFGTADWGLGVHEIGELTLSGLAAGKTYYFEAVQLKRKTDLKAVIFGGAFVGSAKGQDRQSDAYTLHNFQTRKGIIFIDGMPAAEIKETLHSYDEFTELWTQDYTLLGDADLLTPASFVEATPASAVEEMESVFLVPGVYSGATITIPTQVYGVAVWWPYSGGNVTLPVLKHFRGGIAIGAADVNKSIGESTPVNVYSGSSSSGPWSESPVGTWYLDASGFCLTGPLVQPLDAAAKYYKVVIGSKEAVVEVRNRNVSLARLYFALSVHGLLYDRITGELHFETDGYLEYA